ncbi:methyltransferase domain-containing protein [Luminiphilus sp.]|nr:methyltransferase domain-containing protein [Luminiphilus sp.]
MVWRCPSCGQALEDSDDRLLCPANHSFDRSKEGYVNLLPVQKKRSKRPGDSLEMVLGRRAVHEALLYQPLAEALGDVAAAKPQIKTLLDVGCGEGFYAGVLSSRLPHLALYGVDVAKPAVKLAAKTYPHHHYAVASSRDLPVMTSMIDMALCVFSPANDAEISRVLRPGGFYLEIGPGPEHLWQLKSALYEQPREHKPLRRKMVGGCLVDEGEVRYRRTLDNDLLRALLAATPFAFRGRRESRAALQAQSNFLVTIAFSWRLFVVGETGAQ